MQTVRDGEVVPADFVQRRVKRSFIQPTVLGAPEQPRGLIVPFASFSELPMQQQYGPPNLQVKRLIESYARRACRTSIPGLPDDKVTERRVKVYRLVHAVPYPELFRRGQDPNDPQLYRGYFLGEYDKNGKLIEGDRFLYWLLPNVRERGSVVCSAPRAQCRRPGTSRGWSVSMVLLCRWPRSGANVEEEWL